MLVAGDSEGLDRSAVIDEVCEATADRSTRRPPPIYVVNIGGSGSHWVANMLNELPGISEAAEVYIPDKLWREMASLTLEGQARLVDGIHLIHAWGLTRNWAKTREASIVNTAQRPRMIGRFRKWDPECRVLHLYRDPRDRALSVAYRKRTFREESAPEMDDESYLRQKAKRSDTYMRRYVVAEDRADVEVAYEQFTARPEHTLSEVVARLQLKASAEDVKRAVFLHDAANIRAGRVESKGNLDEGGVSRSWRTATTRDRRILHHLLYFPTIALGYELDDCLARDCFDMAPKLPRRNRWQRSGWVVDTSNGGSWAQTDRSWIPSREMVRVRPGEGPLPGELAADIRGADVVCLAGRADVGDDSVHSIADRGGIIGLDLSGTGVTPAVRDAVESMRGLRWLSAIDTSIETWADSLSSSRAPS